MLSDDLRLMITNLPGNNYTKYVYLLYIRYNNIIELIILMALMI